MNNRPITAASFIAVMLLAGGRDAAGQPVNQLCPVMEGEPVDPQFTVQHQGRTIGFCCAACVEKFQANPDRYAARLAALIPAASSPAPSESPAALSSPTGEAPAQSLERPAITWTQLLGRYHPIVVHLPVAAIPLALLTCLLWLATRSPGLAAADLPPLLAGGLASVVAVISGNIAHDAAGFNEKLESYARWHEYSGTTLMIVALLLCAFRVWRWNRLTGIWLSTYLTGLLAATVLVAVSGYFGGTLVHGPGHLWP